jgi:hypothetical protein
MLPKKKIPKDKDQLNVKTLPLFHTGQYQESYRNNAKKAKMQQTTIDDYVTADASQQKFL